MQSSRCILPADSVACQENYAVLRHLELMPVILSAAKDLASLPKRSFAALRMTARTPLTSAHGRHYLQMSTLSWSLPPVAALTPRWPARAARISVPCHWQSWDRTSRTGYSAVFSGG